MRVGTMAGRGGTMAGRGGTMAGRGGVAGRVEAAKSWRAADLVTLDELVDCILIAY